MAKALIKYIPSPTANDFHNDLTNDVKFVMGCVGGGKTTMCCLEMFFTSVRQAPDEQGRRRTRWVVIRNTFPELKSTVIRTWEEWFGDICTTVFDTPIRSTIKQPLPDGTSLEVEVFFLALDNEDSVKKLRSLEVTGAYISEASEINFKVFEILPSRLRWPPNSATAHPILLESNPPSTRSWLYKLFEVERPDGFKIYKQPPPLLYDADTEQYSPNPAAENINFLPGGFDYYYKQLRGTTEEFIKVYILGQYGVTFSGKPVFPQFSQSEHVVNEKLEPYNDRPVIVGMDFGLQPACTFTQMSPTGQVLVLDELVGEDVTLEDFILEHVLPKIQQKFAHSRVLVVGDPSGASRSALAQINSFDMLKKFGIAGKKAVTNDITPRIESVMYFLKRTGGLLVDPRCSAVIEALSGGYKYTKRRAQDLDSDFKDVPDKGKHSHIADSLQYATLYHQRGNRLNKRPKRATKSKFLYA